MDSDGSTQCNKYASRDLEITLKCHFHSLHLERTPAFTFLKIFKKDFVTVTCDIACMWMRMLSGWNATYPRSPGHVKLHSPSVNQFHHFSKLVFTDPRWDSHFLCSESKEFIMGRKETPQKPSRSEVLLFRTLLRYN